MIDFKKDCYIFDLDGTLADCSERKNKAIAGGFFDWGIFFSNVIEDKPNKSVVDYFNYLAHHIKTRTIFILSGRNEALRDETERWFAKYNITGYEAMYMREDGDYRNDVIVKTEMLNKFILPNYNPVLFIDDRDAVVNNWRELGYECWQVASGNF